MLKATLVDRGWRLRQAHALSFCGALIAAAAFAGCEDGEASSPEQVADAGSGSDSSVDPDGGSPGRGPLSASDVRDGGSSVAGDAGGGDAEKGSGPPYLLGLKQACEMRADRYCERMAECSAFSIRQYFAQLDVCKTRTALKCLAESGIEDSGHTAFSTVKCAQALPSATCTTLLSHREPESCRPPGKRRDGSKCGAHSQCNSGYCGGEEGACGVCQVRSPAGGKCTANDACVADLVCGPEGRCLRPGGIGAACDDRQPCRTEFACTGATCQDPLPIGTACESTGQCRSSEGHVCGGDSNATLPASAPQCRVTAVAAPGDICSVDNRRVAYCSGGDVNCVTDGSGVSRCVAIARDGEACGSKAAANMGCAFPARCLAGVCRLGSALSCPP